VEVPNGIDLAAVPRKVDVSLLHRRYPKIAGRRVFLFLGRLDPLHKGLDLLLEAFAQAVAYNFALVIVGPDWQGSMAWLRSRAEALGLGGRVIFTGPAYGREKWSYLAGGDVFVHTSRWEGFAFSVLEALAMGKPVLASTGADPERKINKQGAGFTVPATAKDVAKAIHCLAQLSNEELLRMGSQARAMAEEYDWKHIARSLLEASGA
jgi:glycosyltransferase involved in cell wall biosynthesis